MRANSQLVIYAARNKPTESCTHQYSLNDARSVSTARAAAGEISASTPPPPPCSDNWGATGVTSRPGSDGSGAAMRFDYRKWIFISRALS